MGRGWPVSGRFLSRFSLFYRSARLFARHSYVVWYGLRLNEPLWGNHEAQILACTRAGGTATEEDLHIILNMSAQDIEIQLPEIPLRHWHLAIDIAALSPDDIIERARQRRIDGNIQQVQARSVVAFEALEID